MRAWGLFVRVHDRPGSLERVLGLARRRAMSLRPESVVRGVDGLWSVVFQCTTDGAPIDHYANEFRELVDLDEALPLRAPPTAESLP
jgi:hypothetical protein